MKPTQMQQLAHSKPNSPTEADNYLASTLPGVVRSSNCLLDVSQRRQERVPPGVGRAGVPAFPRPARDRTCPRRSGSRTRGPRAADRVARGRGRKWVKEISPRVSQRCSPRRRRRGSGQRQRLIWRRARRPPSVQPNLLPSSSVSRPVTSSVDLRRRPTRCRWNWSAGGWAVGDSRDRNRQGWADRRTG
jgi:hypothetical protein